MHRIARPAAAPPSTSSGASLLPHDPREVRLGRLAPPPRPCERATIQRASASFDAIGSAAGGSWSATSRHHSGSSSSGIRIVRPNISSGGAVSGMLFPTDELIFSPSQESRSGVVSTTCGSSP